MRKPIVYSLSLLGMMASIGAGQSNIDAQHKSAWAENIGWTNWRDADDGLAGVNVGDEYLSGFVWAENVGWINVGDGDGPYANTDGSNSGVNIVPDPDDPDAGDLTGLAWGENIGWINFGWGHASADPDRARVDRLENRLRGYVWGENVGWINLDHEFHYVGFCPVADFAECRAGVSVEQCMIDDYIDPRAESDDGINFNLGLDRLALCFTVSLESEDGSPLTTDNFSISDTSGNPPDIVGIVVDGQTVTVELSDFISPAERTTISLTGARSTCDLSPFAGSITVGFLPCDVDQNGCVTPFDLLLFRQYVIGLEVPACGVLEDYIDMNREGLITPFDLLVFRQLVNGISPPATQSWAGVCLPEQP